MSSYLTSAPHEPRPPRHAATGTADISLHPPHRWARRGLSTSPPSRLPIYYLLLMLHRIRAMPCFNLFPRSGEDAGMGLCPLHPGAP